MSGGGPAALSFNEFNPLFNRDRVALQGSGIFGENDTWGGEGVVSGIYKKASFSAGYTHFETDGFRTNNDQDDDIANVFAQLELTHKTSIQAEYRYRDTETGDVTLRFTPDDFYPNLRQKEERDSIRFGFHHAFWPGSDLIGNLMYSGADASADNIIDDTVLVPLFPPPIPPLTVPTRIVPDLDVDEEALSGELQHLFRSKYIDVISGGGYFNVDKKNVLVTDVTLFFPAPLPTVQTTSTDDIDADVSHTNLYLYSHINFPKNVTFTLGGSGDFFDSDLSDTEDRDQFNPKFGITWNPFPATTLRGAVFSVLKRTLITDQTLEPTQVAGFNQFFDDANSTDSWRYGIALDQKFSKHIYGGAEFSKRDLEVPAPVGAPFPNTRVDWEEYLGRGYLFWTPHKWLALSAEYLYEQFERDMEFTFGVEEVKTHSFPLGINFFHPSGLSASLKATYYDQDGTFLPLLDDPLPENFVSGEDDFWVVDAAISYRLPKRYGFITVGATNLFDEEFDYYDTDEDNPRIQPERFFFARLTLALP